MTTATAPSRFTIAPRGVIKRPPPRLVVFGEPGVGKTSFGASAPDAVLIPTEDGALGVDVARIPFSGKCETWADLITSCRVVLESDHKFKWLVIDTFNQAEHLCAKMVCDRDFGGKWNTSKGVEGYNAFGKGEKATAEEFRQLLGLLDACQQKRGMGIVMLGHVGLLKQGNALGADFYKFTGDVGKSSWALICGWADQVAHACRDMRTSAREGEKVKASAIGSERWLVFEGGPGRDAKSRAGYEMPERVLLSWEDYDAALVSDRGAALVEQALQLVQAAPEAARKVIEARLGGEATIAKLSSIPRTKLEALIGWLMSKSESNAK